LFFKVQTEKKTDMLS